MRCYGKQDGLFRTIGTWGEYLNKDAEMESIVEEAEEIKKRFNQMPLPELIDEVYSEYPEYAENSVL